MVVEEVVSVCVGRVVLEQQVSLKEAREEQLCVASVW
jgi:hypothetical protein